MITYKFVNKDLYRIKYRPDGSTSVYHEFHNGCDLLASFDETDEPKEGLDFDVKRARMVLLAAVPEISEKDYTRRQRILEAATTRNKISRADLAFLKKVLQVG